MISVMRKLAVLPAFLVKSKPWSAQLRACRNSRSTVLNDILGVFQNNKMYCSNKSTDKTGPTGSDAISKVCSGGPDITSKCSNKNDDAANKSGSMLTFEKIGDSIKSCKNNHSKGCQAGPKVVSPKKLFEAKCGKSDQTSKCEINSRTDDKLDQKDCDRLPPSPPCVKCRFVAKPAMKRIASDERPCLKVDKKPRPRFSAIPAKSNCPQKQNPKTTVENEPKKCESPKPITNCANKKIQTTTSPKGCDLPKPAKCVKKKSNFKAKSSTSPSASSQSIDKCKSNAPKSAKPKSCSVPTTVKPSKCTKPKSIRPKNCEKPASSSKTGKTASTSKCIKSKTPEPIKCNKSKSSESINVDKSKPTVLSEPAKSTMSSKCDKPTKPTKPKCDKPKTADPPKCEKPKPVEPMKCDTPKPIEPATCGVPKPVEPVKCNKTKLAKPAKCDKAKPKKSTKCAKPKTTKPKTAKPKTCNKTKTKPTSHEPSISEKIKASNFKCNTPKLAEDAKCDKPKTTKTIKCVESKSADPLKGSPKEDQSKTADISKCDTPKATAKPPKFDKPKPQEPIQCIKDKPIEPAKCEEISRASKTKSICEKLKDVDVSKCESKVPEKKKDPKITCQNLNDKKETSKAKCRAINLASIAATAIPKPPESGSKKVGGNISSGAPCEPNNNKSSPSKIKIYRNISLATILLVMVFCGYTFLHIEHHERPEFKAYEHMRRRNKRFPWGDGQKSFFHNPECNALPDGYEDDTEDVD